MSDSGKLGGRSEVRDSLFLSASVKVEGDGEAITTRVRNISAGGMMVDGHAKLIEGVRVMSTLRGVGEVEGRVAWVSPDRAGIAFDAEVDPRLARFTPTPRAAEPLFIKVPKYYGNRPGLSPRR